MKYLFVGTEIPYRSCGSATPIVDGRNGCLFKTVNFIKTTTCECTGDLCNSAVKNKIQLIKVAIVTIFSSFAIFLMK